MKNLLVIVILIFGQVQIHAQNTVNIKFGSNMENGKVVTIHENHFYYERYGQGVPVLLLHGGLGSIMDFEKSISDLSAHFQVIALDSPGHGRSSHVDSLSYTFLADNISQFIDHLKLDSLYIMGFSDGGVIGLLLAANRSDKIKKLITIGANTHVDALSESSINWIKNDMIQWAKSEDGWWLTNHLPLMPEPEKLDIYLENTKEMWLTDIYIEKSIIQSIKIPTMIMQGDKDGIKNEHALELSKDIKNSQLCILPDTPHFVFESNADLVNRIAINFFKDK